MSEAPSPSSTWNSRVAMPKVAARNAKRTCMQCSAKRKTHALVSHTQSVNQPTSRSVAGWLPQALTCTQARARACTHGGLSIEGVAHACVLY